MVPKRSISGYGTENGAFETLYGEYWRNRQQNALDFFKKTSNLQVEVVAKRREVV